MGKVNALLGVPGVISVLFWAAFIDRARLLLP
jgi:hypothetical protein